MGNCGCTGSSALPDPLGESGMDGSKKRQAKIAPSNIEKICAEAATAQEKEFKQSPAPASELRENCEKIDKRELKVASPQTEEKSVHKSPWDAAIAHDDLDEMLELAKLYGVSKRSVLEMYVRSRRSRNTKRAVLMLYMIRTRSQKTGPATPTEEESGVHVGW